MEKEDNQLKKQHYEPFQLAMASNKDIVIALAGNPNTGKSTIFNALTGLKQHTGNWPGKTVTNAQGHYIHRGKPFLMVDLPGTYSLLANSVDEKVARDFICFGKPVATVVVTDASNLERNLNLALQVMEITNRVVLAVNLLDEAERKGLVIDLDKLSQELGIPVVGMVARSQKGLLELKNIIDDIVTEEVVPTPLKMKYSDEIEQLVEQMIPTLNSILQGQLDSRWVALRLIDGDETIIESLEEYLIPKEVSIEGEVATICLD